MPSSAGKKKVDGLGRDPSAAQTVEHCVDARGRHSEPRGVLIVFEVLTKQRFFFNDPATTELYPLSLHDALPISSMCSDLPCELWWDGSSSVLACPCHNKT